MVQRELQAGDSTWKEKSRRETIFRRVVSMKKILRPNFSTPTRGVLSLSLVGETRGASLGAFNSSLVRGSVGGV